VGLPFPHPGVLPAPSRAVPDALDGLRQVRHQENPPDESRKKLSGRPPDLEVPRRRHLLPAVAWSPKPSNTPFSPAPRDNRAGRAYSTALLMSVLKLHFGPPHAAKKTRHLHRSHLHGISPHDVPTHHPPLFSPVLSLPPHVPPLSSVFFRWLRYRDAVVFFRWFYIGSPF